ncbi:uncharacterized protein [Typha latifolia]|uniref:uncharacterized protein n=1 Tax=Typha latifolia TaxID=4733 RepID=UPI003C2AD092
MSQFRPTQHHGVNDMQLWQKHLMYRQLQELKRQQQLQQLDHGSRQQNSLGLPLVTGKPAAEEFPAILNKMPITDVSMWSNTSMGGELRAPSNPQMFTAGNVNWTQLGGSPAISNFPNGVMLSNSQVQAMRSMGLVPQELDQSLYGMPVSSTRASVDQYSENLGMRNNFREMVNKVGTNQMEKVSVRSDPLNSYQTEQYLTEYACLQQGVSNSMQNFEGKCSSANASVQSQIDNDTLGNFQQMNQLQHGVQVQEFHGRPGHDNLSDNLLEKSTSVRPTSGVASLDPTEERLLFGTNEDDNWRSSFGGDLNTCTGGYMHGNPLKNDLTGAFPSIQSGSWSALMQEAVEASSSDNGFQEEWSGLSYNKTDQSIVNQSSVSNDNGKQPATWDGDNLQSASSLTSRTFPSFCEADANINCPRAPSFFKSAYEQIGRVSIESTCQQSPVQDNNKQFCQIVKKKQEDSGLQAQMHISNGILAEQAYGRPAGLQFDSHSKQGVWIPRQNMASHGVANESSNRRNGWSTNHTMARNGTNTSNISDSDDSMQNVSRNDVNLSCELELLKSDKSSYQLQCADSSMGKYAAAMNSNMAKVIEEKNRQVLKCQIECGKHGATDSSAHSMGNEDVQRNQNQLNRGLRPWDSSGNNIDRRSKYDSSQEPSDVVSTEVFRQQVNSGFGTGGNSMFAGKGAQYLVNGSQNPLSQSGQHTEGSPMLQNHPARNLGMKVCPSFPPNQAWYSQGLPDSAVGRSNNLEQSYVGHSRTDGDVASINSVGSAERTTGERELNCIRAIPTNDSTESSLDGSTAFYSQDRTVPTSQYMLELIQKVDQSRNVTTVAASDVPGQASHLQLNRPSSQGFGLQLAPPSQRQPLSEHPFSHQTFLNHLSGKDVDCRAGDKDSEPLISTDPFQSLPPNQETSQRKNLEGKSMSAQASKDISYSHNQVDSLLAATSRYRQKNANATGHELNDKSQSRPFAARNNANTSDVRQPHDLLAAATDSSCRYRQQNANATGHELNDKSQSLPFAGRNNVNTSDIRQPHDSRDGALGDQSVWAAFPDSAGKIPPFRFDSSTDAHSSGPSQSHSAETNHIGPSNACFSQIKSGQQFPMVETRAGSQPSIPVMPQRTGFPTMFRNVWTNLSAQQRQPSKLTPNMLQSMILSNSKKDDSFRGLQKVDDQGNKAASSPSEVDASSINLLNQEEKQIMGPSTKQTSSEKVDIGSNRGNASQGQESSRKILDGSCSVSISSLVRLHQQGISKGKIGEDLSVNSQAANASLRNAGSNNDVGLPGRTSKNSGVQHQDYSLLHQMQAMKDSDLDPSNRFGKRLKGDNLGSDTPQIDWKAGQRFVYGQDTMFRVPVDNKIGATSHNSFPSDIKMLSFASSNNEERNANLSSQISGTEASSMAVHAARQHSLENHAPFPSPDPSLNLMKGSELPKINHQMAPSWFEQYGTYIKGHVANNDEQKATIPPFNFPKVSINNMFIEQRLDNIKVGGLGESTPSAKIPADDLPHLPCGTVDHPVVQTAKKRKAEMPDCISWHKVIEGSQRPRSIRMSELDWSQVTNRLIEKVEDEAELLEDGPSTLRPQRRLILTTQLIQQLFPAVPAVVLKSEAALAYESMTYCAAKLALGEACSHTSCLGSDSLLHFDNEKRISEKLNNEKARHQYFSEVVEDIIGKSKRLESDFVRLDKRTLMLDVRLECQELERFSIVNRLGKFHGRSQSDRVEGSSTSNITGKIFPQRYVTALPMTGNHPEGLLCLSL